MKLPGLLIILLVLISGCRKDAPEEFFTHAQPLGHVQAEAGCRVMISPDEYQSEEEMKDLFLERSADECFKAAARKVLQLQPLVRGGRGRGGGRGHEFLKITGRLNPREAPLTRDLSQDFSCILNLYPEMNLSGTVMALEEEKTMAGTHDRVIIRLMGDYPARLPAFFMVARKNSRLQKDLGQVYGSGSIVQIMDPARGSASSDEKREVLIYGEILETRHEVSVGDLVFLVSLEVKADRAEPQAAGPGSTPQDREVMVKPQIKDSSDTDKQQEMK